MSSKCFYHAACVLQNSHLLHLEIWQVFKGLSWTETHYFSLQRPLPLSLMKPIFCSIFLFWPYLGHFQGSNCVVDVHEAIFFGLHLCKKIAPSIFWLFVFLMFVNLYRSQRSCENLLKYPAWKYLLKEHAPHF